MNPDLLRASVVYDPTTGLFDKPSRVDAGGYVAVRVGGRAYSGHRLAWLCAYGAWPVKALDHIDRDKTNNRIGNLREACHALNAQNRFSARRDSATGVQGVQSHGRRFVARIQAYGYNRHLGVFDTVEQAADAYRNAKAEMHGKPRGTEVKKEKPTSGPGSRQPTLKLPTVMPDGAKTRVHPLLHLLKNNMGDSNKSDLARVIGVKPQSLYKWEKKCAEDRHFPLPIKRAFQIAGFFRVDPHLFRPDVFKVAA